MTQRRASGGDLPDRVPGTGAAVRWFLSLFFAVATVGAESAPARADALTLVARYAQTLQQFDRRLDAAQATRLAMRTVGEASDFGIDARLIVALIAVESDWRPAAVSTAGARGLGQLMPATAAGLGVDPDDPDANLDGTIRHLSGLVRRYAAWPTQARFERSIAAYNAGAGAVDRYAGIPPYSETQAYVRRVIGLWRRLAGM